MSGNRTKRGGSPANMDDQGYQDRIAELEASLQEARVGLSDTQIELSVYKRRCAEKDEEISQISITATRLNIQLQAMAHAAQ